MRFFYAQYKFLAIDFPADYPNGAILGRVIIVECLTWQEYQNQVTQKFFTLIANLINFQYPDGECSNLKHDFVLILRNPETLMAPIPHIPLGRFYQVKRELKNTIKQLLDPYFLG